MGNCSRIFASRKLLHHQEKKQFQLFFLNLILMKALWLVQTLSVF